ncbi:MAG: alpha-ketoacid dehydrogenase subunit beta [Leptospiraceae bacterium]|nr:alpha-ketoacid dehydrogenase subunit beta [Leptospiraceae bacterium]
MRNINYAQAINEATSIAMGLDSNVICYGLGVDDPKGVFGTTLGLQENFGENRVFDMPTSENAMTGIAIGASLNGIRPIMTHQRVDFFLLAMDQLVNNAAKWYYMFGGKRSIPITIRLIIGHGWGQGPTHSQNLQSWFAHIPGLKVVMPTLPVDAKGLLLSSIFDENPVIFLEHRWLHNTTGNVPEGDFREPLGKARVIRKGSDVTIVSMSYMTIEAIHAAEVLEKAGIEPEIIDLRTIRPIDWETIYTSVKKTSRFLALDTASESFSVSSELITRVSLDLFDILKNPPMRIGQPDFPSPTSFGLTKGFYKGAIDICKAVSKMLGKRIDVQYLEKDSPHDAPGDWFKGPF